MIKPKTALPSSASAPWARRARSYLAAGYSVTVWNRTASKAELLAEEGAVRAKNVTDALKANKLIILSLTEYDIMYKVLDGAEQALKGRVLVNLSSDTPRKARRAEVWVQSHGAEFLSGGVMVDPPLVGNPEALTFYSGKREIFDVHHPALRILGKADYRGSDAGLSQLYNQALLNILFTGATAVLQSISMVKTEGVTGTEFEPYVMSFLEALPYFFQGMGAEADAMVYRGEENNMKMMVAAAAHVAHTARDTGVRTDLTDLISDLYHQTVASGHGHDGLTSVIEVLKN